jgi:AcrR family transcriptional regulator
MQIWKLFMPIEPGDGLSRKAALLHKKPSAGRPRDPEMDATILRAATTILRRRGYGGFSIEAVASQAGVTRQSVYRRWKTKSDLLVEIYMNGLSSIDYDKYDGFRKAYSQYIFHTVSRAADLVRGKVLLGLAVESQSNKAVRAIFLDKIIAPRRSIGRHLINRAIQAGEVRKNIDVEMALDISVGPVWFNLIVSTIQSVDSFHKRLCTAFFEYCSRD